MKVLLCLLITVSGALGRASVVPRVALPDGRIIGGHDAVENENPYQASLQYGSGDTFQHVCGAVILTRTTVLSAAHCVALPPNRGSYRVLAGTVSLNDDNPERQYNRVSYVVTHPSYKGGIGPHDLAIFKMAAPFVFSDAVGAANIPTVDYHVSGPARIIGWGSIGGIETPIMPTIQQVADVELMNSTDCRKALDNVLNGQPHPFDDDDNICTGPLSGGWSICTGDSGGALTHTRFDGATDVIAIASWGVTPCGTVGAPSVFVKILNNISWIRQFLLD